MTELYAIIVAGGSGNRMNSNLPKQFMLLNNKPVLMHTIEKFHQFDASMQLIVVLPEKQFETWENLCNKYEFTIQHQLVAGGKERFESVKNGLDLIPENGIVFIHDGVRPLVSIETIQCCLNMTTEMGNAIPVLPVVESLRQIKFGHSRMADRKHFATIQTPQVFKTAEIKAAYALGFDPAFTDDSSVLERTGATIHLVEGNRENIKITHPIDLKIAEALISSI